MTYRMKRLLTLTIAVLFCFLCQAQSIVGSWKGAPVKERQKSYESINQTDQAFKSDGSFSETSNVDISLSFPTGKKDTLYLNCKARVAVAGTYTLTGSKLLLKYEYKKAEGKLLSINVRSTDAKVQKEIDENMATIEKYASGFMAKELKKSYKDVNGEKTILKVTSDVLEYKTKEGVIYTFKKSK